VEIAMHCNLSPPDNYEAIMHQPTYFFIQNSATFADPWHTHTRGHTKFQNSRTIRG